MLVRCPFKQTVDTKFLWDAFYRHVSLPLSLSPQLLKKLKRAHEAVLNFSWALDFSRHGGSSHIQEEVDEMYQVSGAEGRNGEEDFFVHHSDSDGEDEANQLQEGEDQN